MCCRFLTIGGQLLSDISSDLQNVKQRSLNILSSILTVCASRCDWIAKAYAHLGAALNTDHSAAYKLEQKVRSLISVSVSCLNFPFDAVNHCAANLFCSIFVIVRPPPDCIDSQPILSLCSCIVDESTHLSPGISNRLMTALCSYSIYTNQCSGGTEPFNGFHISSAKKDADKIVAVLRTPDVYSEPSSSSILENCVKRLNIALVCGRGQRRKAIEALHDIFSGTATQGWMNKAQ
ncbi:hypothetical protein AB6A40_009489 [Gnathostoma spinigerum]|uniref:MMS19 nucleotide excision repair protein n=1 Tax=Gnathostoma spinigerum TaxID=75299 RepID=A0ABD6ETC3_9BILA